MGVETSAGVRKEYHLDKLPSKILNNYVLVRVDFDPSDDIKLPSGIILSGLAGTKFQEASYVARYGVVELVPDFLKERPKYEFEGVMEWGTKMELQKGDVCYFTKMASANAEVLFIGDIKYFRIHYSEIIVRIRNGVIRPLNGYVIVDKVTEKTRRKGLLLDFGDFQDKRLGVVRYTGTPNSFYYDSNARDADVEVGDEVIFDGGFWTALEDSMFSTLDEDLGFVQRGWVIGKF